MNAPMLHRRGFLLTGVAASGALLVGCARHEPAERVGAAKDFPLPAATPAGRTAAVGLNAWVAIDPTTGAVTVAVPRAEMGQGAHTVLALLVAEELDADWALVQVAPAPVARVYANTTLLTDILPLQPDDDSWIARTGRSALRQAGWWLCAQVTGGSSSVRDAWEPLRLAGATARAMLVSTAAARWGVKPEACRTEAGAVVHPQGGQRLRYGELAAEAARLSPPSTVGLKRRADWKLLGRPAGDAMRPRRLEGHAKVIGTALYGADIALPGLLHAVVSRCPVIGGRLLGYEDGPVLQRPGVRQVVALGEHAVAVVADRYWTAEQARRALNIRWDEGLQATLDTEELSQMLQRELESGSPTRFRNLGDAEGTLTSAAAKGKSKGEGERVLEATYEVPFLAHQAMEPLNATAQLREGKLTLWVGTQVPPLALWKAAQAAGVSIDDVTLHEQLIGSAFGRRLETDFIEEAAQLATKTNGAPVRVHWSREDDLRHDVYRPAALGRLRAVLDAQGRPQAWWHRVAAPSISNDLTLRVLPPSLHDFTVELPDKTQIEGAFELPYAIPNLQVQQVLAHTPLPVGFWRSVGHSYTAFFNECFADELAEAAKQDPVTWRLALLKDRPRHRTVLEAVAKAASWDRPVPAGRARGVALHESYGSVVGQVAEVSLEADRVRVHQVHCVVDCGVALNPDHVVAQMEGAIAFALSAALHGEIRLKDGRVVASNFHDAPVLRISEMPAVAVQILDSEAAPGGVGEAGVPPLAPAVANAVSRLTGQRIRRLPIRPALSRAG